MTTDIKMLVKQISDTKKICSFANFKSLYTKLANDPTATNIQKKQWSAVKNDVLNRCDGAMRILPAALQAISNSRNFSLEDAKKVAIPGFMLSKYTTAMCRLKQTPSCPAGLQTVTCSTVNCENKNENENVVPVAAQPRKKEFAPLQSGFWTGGKHSRRSKRKHKKRTTRRRY